MDDEGDDPGNARHVAEHGVTPDEVNERMRKQLEAISPEKRARLEAYLADTRLPEIQEARREAADAVEREVREAGGIAIDPDPEAGRAHFAFRRFMGRLRGHRQSLGLSLGDVARISGLERAAVSRMELGHNNNPTRKTLDRYAAALGVRIAWEFESAGREEAAAQT